MESTVVAAGGVVHRVRSDGKQEFLLVHRPRYDDWSLPKGKLDAGETFKQAAKREVLEETGFKCDVGTKLGTVSYVTPADNRKVVRYWLMEPKDGTFTPNSEVDEVRWLPAFDAATLLTHPLDRAVLGRAANQLANPDSGRVYLVRHAHAGTRRDWKGDDHQRPLSKKGKIQAKRVRKLLSTVPITRVASSPYIRCLQTVHPIAAALHLEIDQEAALAEDATPADALKLIKQSRARTVVMCTHRQLIAELLAQFGDAGIPLNGGLVWEKGSAWVLETVKGKVRAGRYWHEG